MIAINRQNSMQVLLSNKYNRKKMTNNFHVLPISSPTIGYVSYEPDIKTILRIVYIGNHQTNRE